MQAIPWLTPLKTGFSPLYKRDCTSVNNNYVHNSNKSTSRIFFAVRNLAAMVMMVVVAVLV